jgi:hypothetical protein
VYTPPWLVGYGAIVVVVGHPRMDVHLVLVLEMVGCLGSRLQGCKGDIHASQKLYLCRSEVVCLVSKNAIVAPES